MEKELRERLKDIQFTCELPLLGGVTDTYRNGARSVLRLVHSFLDERKDGRDEMRQWLDDQTDGWHDLEKDPNDLPGSGVHVCICIRGHPTTYLGYNTTSYGWHYDYGVPFCTGTKICAWRAYDKPDIPERFKK